MKKRILGFVLAVALILSGAMLSYALVPEVGGLSGEQSRTTSEITLSDGTKTGVRYTNMKLSGYYSNKLDVNITEADLSNTNLSIDVINCGTYIASKKTVRTAISDYMSANSGKTVLSAINGDLWIDYTHNNENITKQTLRVTRGAMIIGGEVWATQQIDQENIEAENAEKGTPAGNKVAFGTTFDNQPLVGTPVIDISLDIEGAAVEADGLNRLPATNSIIVYNNRVYSTNYALNDSYEVVIKFDGGSGIYIGKTIEGTVTEIYEAGSTTRPSLSAADTIVLTARGDRIEELRALMAVGKKVKLSTSITDLDGNTELWKNIRDAMGGHMRVLKDGDRDVINNDTSNYPTAFIGYKNNGNIAMVTVTNVNSGSYAGLKFYQAHELCKELGYNNVFYLDGGGSATFVTLEEGTYTVRNQLYDSTGERSVISAVALVWNDTPVCEVQGDLSYINVLPNFSELSPEYISGEMMVDLLSSPNTINISYDETEEALSLSASGGNDPFVTLDYSKLLRVNAEDYSYIVVKAKSTASSSTAFGMYYAAGDYTYASGDRYASTVITKGNSYKYYVIEMAGSNGWSGVLNNIRLDIFDGITPPSGANIYIQSISLCKTESDVDNIKNGILPEGAIEDYSAYLESLKPEPRYTVGDINGDGLINLRDAFMLRNFIAYVDSPNVLEKLAADADGDGKISIRDSFEVNYRISNGAWRK